MKQPLQNSWIPWLGLVLSALLLLSACSGRPTPSTQSTAGSLYQSRMDTAAAEALYAYSRFRLLGGEGRWSEAITALSRAVVLDPDSAYLRFMLARAYRHNDQIPAAVATLQELLREQPDNLEVHEQLGEIQLALKDYPGAVSHLRQALALGSSGEATSLRLAMALAGQQQLGAAIEVLDQYLAASPRAPRVRLALARFLVRDGQEQRALAAYDQALQQLPYERGAALEYGTLLEQHLPEEALAFYRRAIEANPDSAALRQRLAQLYLHRGQILAALEEFERLRAQYPGNSELVARTALLKLDLERWPAAVADYRHLLEEAPQKAEYRFYLAMALVGQGQVEAAITELEAIPSAAPLYGDAQFQLGYLYNRSGHPERAISALQRAREAGVQQPELYYYLAAFWGDQGHLEEALQAARDGLARYPDDTRLYYQLGLLYEKQERRPDALRVMEKILTLKPDHADALNFLAYHQAEHSLDLDLALDRARRALAQKNSGYILDTLGWVYYKLGRFSASRYHLEQAHQRQPQDAVIAEHLGDVYRALRLEPEAIRLYRKSLQLDPSASAVEDKLQQLLQKGL